MIARSLHVAHAPDMAMLAWYTFHEHRDGTGRPVEGECPKEMRSRHMALLEVVKV